jgi:hypothetical protein
VSRLRPGGDRHSPDDVTEKNDGRTLLVKQLAYAVTGGKKVTLHLDDGRAVTGYAASHDDCSLLILAPDDEVAERFSRTIVQRAHITCIDLHDEPTFQREPEMRRLQMEQILSKYRSVMWDRIGRKNPPGGSS